MTPPTAKEKAIADRELIKSKIEFMETRVQQHGVNPLTEPAVSNLLQRLNDLDKELEEVHKKILHAAPSEVDVQNVIYIELYEKSMTIRCELDTHLITFRLSNPVPNPITTAATSRDNNMRLSRIELPTFSGDSNDWLPFRDMFMATVDLNTSLTNTEKLIHLQRSLNGEAARVIQTLALTDGNYNIAWKALIERYQNEKELLFATMNKIFSQPQITPQSASSIRSLVDTTKNAIRTFTMLKGTIDHVFVYLMYMKLDSSTKELLLQQTDAKKIPDLEKIYDFLEQRGMAIATSGTSSSSLSRQPQWRVKPQSHYTHYTQSTEQCALLCNDSHFLFKCPKFLGFNVQQRIDHLKKEFLCFNCLRGGHSVQRCPSKNTCRTCGKIHHTLIHVSQPNSIVPENNESTNYGSHAPGQIFSNHGQHSEEISSSLLATAVIRITGSRGEQICRVLLDGGSSTSFITASCVQRLGLHVRPAETEITGLSASSVGSATGVCTFIMKPHFKSDSTYQVDALIMKQITSQLPSQSFSASSFTHLHDLQLADPQFHTSSSIDILLGSDIFWTLLENEKRCGFSNQPTAVKTTLGWLVAGPYQSHRKKRVNSFITNLQLDNRLQQFWETENIPAVENAETDQPTPTERACEEFYLNTTTRDVVSGRFTACIPWKHPKPEIGESRSYAVRRLLQMERRLSSKTNNERRKSENQHYKNEYIQFMREYQELGHMTQVPPLDGMHPNNNVYYIPHHFVLKSDSTTTKFRVVFDGSAKSSTGNSINDAMMIGATVQSTLFEIVLRFRMNPVAYCADIAKMYRQILIALEDRDFQRILWREEPSQPILEYQLNTVTYGTAAAPFLATRTLNHLADLEKAKYPNASAMVRDSVYVDDLMGGNKNTEEAITTTTELRNMADSAGFSFRKWTSNDPALLQSIPPELREVAEPVPLNTDIGVKTLGIHWYPIEDNYRFKITLAQDPVTNYTKRMILSEMSQLFDPLGWLAPVTIQAKILMQQIWTLNIEWDTALPSVIQEQWVRYRKNLKKLEEIKIPRYVFPDTITKKYLVGYADASLRAYSAVVYIATIQENESIHFALLTAKTRVSPIKPVTLPRLELNAAVLLAELVTKVNQTLAMSFDGIKTFSDSTITLAWINSDPLRWKTYVRNRVARIQELLPTTTWAHIKGEMNPADCASRGLFPDELLHHNLWWSGCSSSIKCQPEPILEFECADVTAEEAKNVNCLFATKQADFRFITYFSSWNKLKHFVALILRKQRNFKAIKHSTVIPEKQAGPFSVEELDSAANVIFKHIQASGFPNEWKCLESKLPLPSSSKLLCLNPFLDSNGIIRVGGRLRHAPINYNQKHPILLPNNHPVTRMIIINIHCENFHSGSQLTLSIFNQQFWVLRGRDTIRFQLKRCVVCEKHKGTTLSQIMGDLPSARVTPSKAFQTTGVDCAGPFTLKNAGRSKVTFKAYLVVFVCFTTRAIHLQLVSSMATETFIAAFRRFISRRGRPRDMYSDCGTNFVGARRVIGELQKQFGQAEQKRLADEFTQDGIQWHFNPPGAPHFGGLWEAGVKSVKHHLFRVIGNAALTFEEMTTLLTQIEGILNSRPLTVVSSNPDDLQALTPSHFLIGGPIVALPEPNLLDINIGRLDRWQAIQQRQQAFWKRWSSEFISRLQQRPKWIKEQPQLEVNSIVIIKDENLPPSKWRLGRVIALHPGKDGNVRVATIKTLTGEIKRPITKLCVLPIDH